MTQAYLEILDVRTGEACKTGLGAIFETNEQTKQSFDVAKSMEVKKGQEDFILDYYNANGDLDGTILLDSNGVKTLTGFDTGPAEYYKDYDKQYWVGQRLRSKIQSMEEKAQEPETVEVLNSVLTKMDELGL